MNKIDKDKFGAILDAWESVFNEKDFFTDAKFVGTKTAETKTCKSKYGTLNFNDCYLNLDSPSKGHLLFHFRRGGDGSSNQFHTLQLSHNDDNVIISVKDIMFKPTVLLEQFFSASGREQFYRDYMLFLEQIKETEKEFKNDFQSREWS